MEEMERTRGVLQVHDRFAVAACWDTYRDGEGKVRWAGPVVVFGDQRSVGFPTVLVIALDSEGLIPLTIEPRYVHGVLETPVFPGGILRKDESGQFESLEAAVRRVVRGELGFECASLEVLGAVQLVHQSVNDQVHTYLVKLGDRVDEPGEKVSWYQLVELIEAFREGQIQDSQSRAAFLDYLLAQD